MAKGYDITKSAGYIKGWHDRTAEDGPPADMLQEDADLNAALEKKGLRLREKPRG